MDGGRQAGLAGEQSANDKTAKVRPRDRIIAMILAKGTDEGADLARRPFLFRQSIDA
jgi:hypothetical protein